MKIDLNCDVGEGVVNEHLIMQFISSCNIACGGHFGDKNTIDKTIGLALENNVKIGAHPSFPDKINFGRKLMQISNEDLKQSIKHQVELLLDRLAYTNASLNHIKPHGALYNAIAVDETLALLFIDAVKEYLIDMYLYVPYNSVIEKVAINNDVRIKYEAFADRNYNNDLTLVSRTYDNAVLVDKKDVFCHVLNMLKNQKVVTILGKERKILVDTFCVHSDTKNALDIVRFLFQNLEKEGFKIE